MVDTGVAGQYVVEPVSSSVDIRRSREDQVFGIWREGVADATADSVISLPLQFDYRVPGRVNEIRVISCAPGENIGPGAAVQHVISATAGQAVVGSVSYQHVVEVIAGCRQVF